MPALTPQSTPEGAANARRSPRDGCALRLLGRALGRPFLKSVELKDFTVYESIDNSPYVRWQPAAAEKP